MVLLALPGTVGILDVRTQPCAMLPTENVMAGRHFINVRGDVAPGYSGSTWPAHLGKVQLSCTACRRRELDGNMEV